MEMKIAILTLFLVCSSALVADDYLLVDQSTGVTNGPVDISPNATIIVGGRTYNVLPVTGPLMFESRNIPRVAFSNTPVMAAIDFALLNCGLTNESSAPQIAVFHGATINKTVTFSARDITLGELIRLICEMCDLTLIRDRASQALILVPNSIYDERTARAFGILPSVYNEIVKSDGSFNRLLVTLGVIRRESDMLCEFQQDRSLLILYGSREALRRVSMTFSMLSCSEENSQPTPVGDSQPASRGARMPEK